MRKLAVAVLLVFVVVACRTNPLALEGVNNPNEENVAMGTGASNAWFSIRADALIALVGGQSLGYTVALSRQDGFTDVVSFTLSGLPPSVSAASELSIAGDEATFTLAAALDAPDSGPHIVTVTAAAGAATASLTFSLSVQANAGFSVEVAELFNIVSPQQTLAVSIVRAPFFDMPVEISLTNLPATLHANGVTLDAQASHVDVAFDAEPVADLEEGELTLSASAAGITKTVTIHYFHYPPSSFTMAAEPTSVTLARTSQVSFEVVVSRSTFYDGVITVTSLALPEGVTMSPPMLTIDRYFDRGTLTLSADAGATLGDAMLSLYAEGGTTVPARQLDVPLTVTDAPGFSLLAPSTALVQQGASADLALSVTRNNGFDEALSTELLTPPAGVSASGGAFAGTDTMSTLTLEATPSALLLVPTSSLVSVAPGGGSAEASSVTITVTPAADPHLDAGFGLGGAALVEWQPNNVNQYIVSRVLADDRLFAVSQTRVARVNADGSLQGEGELLLPSFANYGAIMADGTAYGVSTSGTDAAVARVLADGASDTSFGTGGTASLPGVGFIEGIAVRETDDAIFLYGEKDGDFVVVKLTSGGVLDTTFSGDGIAHVDFGGSDGAKGLLFAASDKVEVFGTVQPTGVAARYGMCRLTAAGVPDTSFDGDGLLTLTQDAQTISAVRRLSDGSILIVGDASIVATNEPRLRVSKLTAAGAMDTGFGSNGRVDLFVGEAGTDVRGVIEDSSGRFLAYGSRQNQHRFFRLTSTGGLDTTFSNDGVDGLNGGSGDIEFVSSLAIDNAGNYYVFGRHGGRTTLARYLP